MIGHEAIGPHLRARFSHRVGQQVQIQRVIRRLEERLRSPIATLRDMMGYAGENEAGETSHVGMLAEFGGLVNCHRNSVIP